MENRQWWVQRWLELLDSYRFKKRLERARNYAREGNILSIDFQNAQVLAQVQGSEVEPYQVSLSLTPFTDDDWDYVVATLSQKALYSAQLLAGQMPTDIEQVFTTNGLSLFPFTLSDIRSRCSCPDKANPCKHIGAVYYHLADRFSEDPFVLFQLRGRTKEQILIALRDKRHQQSSLSNSLPSVAATMTTQSSQETTQRANLENFWSYLEPLDSSLVVIVPLADHKTVADLLGLMPLPYEDAQIVEQYLTAVYQTSDQQVMASSIL